MPHGYTGKILQAHLNDLSLEVETPPEEFYRTYYGGSALGLYYLLKNTPPNADPLGPENTLVLSVGVATGTAISGQSRLTATAKSPVTCGVGDSQSGGFFPAELKFAGFDAIVVHGKAEKPVFLWVNNGEAELRPAEHLWGKVTGEVEDIIKEELKDEKIQILQTGIAGENGVLYGALLSMSNRANGRTGMGTVMASKNLKAIAVRGKQRPQVADQEGLKQLARWGVDEYPDSDVYGLGLLGTAEIINGQNAAGGFPTHNWDSGTFEGWEKLDGKNLKNTVLKERDSCYACVVRCKRVVEITAGPYKVDPTYGGPEYETLATLGSYCGIDDLEAVSFANQLCNMYGLDTISCGATIAWAMDCYEKGLLTKDDTNGIALRFGDGDAMVKMVEKIARRDGFGDLLAKGSARAAQKIGRGTEDLVVAVKKHEVPAHMPQVKRSLGLIYAVNPFGADHCSHEHDPSYSAYPERMAEIGLTNPQDSHDLNEENVRYALLTQYNYSALDTVNVCQFVFGPAWQLYSTAQLAELVRCATGWDVSVEELQKLGERRLNMMRAFNAREGFDRVDDTIPRKFLQPLKGGASDGIKLTIDEVEKAKDIYYKLAGWDVITGNPTKEKLVELGLEWLIDI